MGSNRTGLRAIYFLFFVFLTIFSALGQVPSSGAGEQGRAAQYILGDQDQVLMPVNVWGFVTKPVSFALPWPCGRPRSPPPGSH